MSDQTKFNEENLIKAIKCGDDWAYKYVYLKYYDRLCIYILNFTQDRTLAEDIVQDTFLTLWIKKETLQLDRSLNGYLYKLAYNKFVDIYRKTKKMDSQLENIRREALIELLENNDDTYYKKLSMVEHAIEELPTRCKEIFILNKINGLRYKEIAEKLGISTKTVENQIGKALSFIRKQIDTTLLNLFMFFKKGL